METIIIKRSLDIFLSLIGISVTIPLLPFIALLIKMDSKGPVFFLCDRVGKDGRLFKMYKFRTMYDTPVPIGASLSPADDPRVTRFGRFLRRTKLNELPQLMNILMGNMTFVGPRPEAPDLAALYPSYAKRIFDVKPGLVGPNQILGRNEEEWYPPGVDPQQYYIESILPKKLPVDLAYVEQSSLFKDIKFIFLGIKETVFKVLTWKLILQNKSQIYLLCIDIFFVVSSFMLASILRLQGEFNAIYLVSFLPLLPTFVLIRIACFFYFGLYSTLIRHISTADIIGIFKGVSVSSILLISLTFFFDVRTGSRLIFCIDWLLLIVLMTALRFGLRLFCDWLSKRGNHAIGKKTVLIFGAGAMGFLAYQFLMAQQKTVYDIVGFLDDDPTKRHKTLCGKRVLGNSFNIKSLVKLYQVDEIFFAVTNIASHKMMQIIQACQEAKVQYRFLSTLQDRTIPHSSDTSGVETDIADLFKMQHIEMDWRSVRRLLEGKRVLLTGASGALGVELCRRILGFSPQSLIILERYESYLTTLMVRLQQAFPDATIIPMLCSPVGIDNIGEVFREYAPHIVFHNAMRKYPPFFSFQTPSILRSNYLWTFALAKHAAHCESTYFVLVSSEEAANRGNLIADSLRAAEIGLRQFFAAHKTHLVIARLCDILESRGGIVSILEEQIAHREVITLPHQEAQCYILSKHAAADFILETLAQADTLSLADGIFICNHGAPLSLLEIAGKLAMLRGLQLGQDIPIRFLNSTPQDNRRSTQVVPSDHHVLVSTANTSIGLLREKLLSCSHETFKVIEDLLSMQEQDLDRTCWEQHTRTLLLLETKASSEART
jgi:FlaA1/EpsC-like NDP-sugar epimerase/lipopolysaccharide/colanic/teichoic acid biosynthesis glycosyltransferase